MPEDDVTLYDLRAEGSYPRERGDVFRTVQVAHCHLCGARTNRCVMGGNPGYGVRFVCPNSRECWHHEIEEKTDWAARPHPRSYLRELEAEIAELRAAGSPRDDLLGPVDASDPDLRRSVTNTFSTEPGATCRHRVGAWRVWQ